VRHDYKILPVAAAGAIGFATGISWASQRIRKKSFDELRLRDRNVTSQSSRGASRHQLPPSMTQSSPMTEILEPFSPDVLKRRIVEVFPAGYLTMIAIIQGVALGAAIVTTQQQLQDQRGTINRFTVVSQALTVFVAIVVITHRYLILTIDDRWAPTIFDTLIPYALGVGEITTAVVIGRNVTWWIAVSVLFLAAAGTYAHTYIRVPGAPSQGSDRKSIRTRMIYCCALLGYSATVAALTAVDVIPGWLGIILPYGTIIGAIAIAINGERTQNRLYDSCDIPRWRLRLLSLNAMLMTIYGKVERSWMSILVGA
jgi:hypothetical protein